MRKILVLLLSFTLFTAISSKSYAQCVNPDTRSTISVTGMATENVAPDTAYITLSVETQAKTVKEALNMNNQKADSVIKKLKNQINPQQKDSIKTTSFNIQPVYEYDNSKKKPFLIGYKVINQITVTTKSINNAGNIVDVAVESGANRLQNISFGISNNSEYCRNLLSKASQNAREQAEVVSKALGVKISGIKTVSMSCNDGGARPMYRGIPRLGEGIGAMAESAVQTPVEAGDISVNANVNIDFFITNP